MVRLREVQYIKCSTLVLPLEQFQLGHVERTKRINPANREIILVIVISQSFGEDSNQLDWH